MLSISISLSPQKLMSYFDFVSEIKMISILKVIFE